MTLLSTRRTTAALAAAVSLSLVAACGGSSSDEGAAKDQVVTIDVGLIPIAAVAPIYLGMQKGIFEQNGLRVEPALASSGSAIVPAVLNGEQQFGFSNIVSMITAADKGLPVRVVANGSQAGPGNSSRFEAIVVRDDSDIEVPKDLEGKTVSVNALGAIGSLLIDAALEKEGVDVSKIRYTELPFSDVNAAVSSGRIDAGYQTEPFVTGGQSSGLRVLLNQYEALAPEVSIANYFTSADYAEDHPEVVTRFQAAVKASLTYASEHEAEVRAVLGTYTSIPAALSEKMVLPAWTPDLDPGSAAVQVVVDAALKAGTVSEAPDLDALFLD